jgi:hypothetical protein
MFLYFEVHLFESGLEERRKKGENLVEWKELK